MESIGEKLKSTRSAKKLTIRDVVKQTNINPVYINALEDEDFDKFPSETYLIGFLRSYSEFLKLNSEEIIQSYRGYKIGESATPLEELTKSTKPPITMAFSALSGRVKSIVFPAVVAILVLLIYYGIKSVISSKVDIEGRDTVTEVKDSYKSKDLKSKIENLRNLQLPNNSGFVLVYKNEAVQFMVENKEIIFLLKEIKDNSVYIEFLPGEKVEVIEMDKPSVVKIDGIIRDIVFTLKGLTENRAKILVKIEKGENISGEKIVKDEVKIKKESSIDVIARDKKNLRIVFEAIFEQTSFIELYLDGNMKKRGFIPGGRKERWEATEYIQVKLGNAGGIKVKVNGKDFTFGKPGQVANKIITWEKDIKNPNLYHIVVKDW